MIDLKKLGTTLEEALKNTSREDWIRLYDEWKAAHLELGSYQDWKEKLRLMYDETGFNQFVIETIYRVVDKWFRQDKFSGFGEIDYHMEELRDAVDAEVRYLPDMKYYFGVRTKDEAKKYDLSKYGLRNPK